jgi:hypothetical protein
MTMAHSPPKAAPRRSLPVGKRARSERGCGVLLSAGSRPTCTSWRTVVVTSTHVISGSMKEVPTVSVTMLARPGSGSVQSGIPCCPRTISQVISAFNTRLITPVMRLAL